MISGLLPTQSSLRPCLCNNLVARVRRQQRLTPETRRRSQRSYSSVISNIATAPLPPATDVQRPAQPQTVRSVRLCSREISLLCLLVVYSRQRSANKFRVNLHRSWRSRTYRSHPRSPWQTSSARSLSTAGRRTQPNLSATWSGMWL